MSIVDRRENPAGKSHVNRQRFMRRQKEAMQKAVGEVLKGRNIGDSGGQDITIPDTGEPVFRRNPNTGTRDRVLPGNKGGGSGHVVGDQIWRPDADYARAGASRDGGGEHDFRIRLDYDEFVQLFLEDMGLPDLLKEAPGGEEKTRPQREGFARTGSPHNLHLPQTAENALARRIALRRPNAAALAEAKEEVERLLGGDEEQLAQARRKLKDIEERRNKIPFIDTSDQRFRRFERKPAPSAQAVMFCLMDVSGSMDEQRQELAKRFFLLMKIFLEKKHKRVDIVFIRHTDKAREVDENTFFNDPESGGTVVSTALEEMQRIIKERYNPERWNIYGAQISDGENYPFDDRKCLELMKQPPHGLLLQSQFFAYVQTDHDPESKKWLEELYLQHGFTIADIEEPSLWTAYKTLLPAHDNFAMQRVSEKRDIALVMAKLFAKNKEPSLQAAGRAVP